MHTSWAKLQTIKQSYTHAHIHTHIHPHICTYIHTQSIIQSINSGTTINHTMGKRLVPYCNASLMNPFLLFKTTICRPCSVSSCSSSPPTKVQYTIQGTRYNVWCYSVTTNVGSLAFSKQAFLLPIKINIDLPFLRLWWAVAAPASTHPHHKHNSRRPGMKNNILAAKSRRGPV